MPLAPARTHPWRVSAARAMTIQRALREQVVIQPFARMPEVVAGLDVSVRGDQASAAVVSLTLPTLEPIDAATASRPVPFPYVPGLLAFREAPVILDALEQLETTPQVLVFDAHGLAHPRRFGLAAHVGVLLDWPSIGCAKSRLCGEYDEPDPARGSWTGLREDDEVIGAVLRTRDDVKPVFVSVGHRTDLESAISVILACAAHYRLPETTRWAHRVAGGDSFPVSGTADQP